VSITAADVMGALWLALFPLFAIHLYFAWRVLTRLEKHHREIWVQLGSPTVFANNSLRNALLSLRFLYRHEYRTIDDPILRRYCSLLFVLNLSCFIAFGVVLVLMLATHGRSPAWFPFTPRGRSSAP
jgi:hypothetical protein